MKIVKASRYREVFDRQNALISRRNEQIQKYENQMAKYYQAVKSKNKQVARYITDVVAEATSKAFANDLKITCTMSKHIDDAYPMAWVAVEHCPKDSDLYWNWEFSLNRAGKRAKDSNASWQGLGSLTVNDLETLKNSIGALNALNQLNEDDLMRIVSEGVPTQEETVTQKIERVNSYSLLEEMADSLIGEDAYLMWSWQPGQYDPRPDRYFKVLDKFEDKFGKSYECLIYETDSSDVNQNDGKFSFYESDLRFKESDDLTQQQLFDKLNVPLVFLVPEGDEGLYVSVK